jgi:hypothetical protein
MRVFSAFYMHPDNASMPGVRATAARLGDQLRQLEAEGVCPEMPAALTALLDQADPPTSASELERFSGEYAEWATSIGLGRGLPDSSTTPCGALSTRTSTCEPAGFGEANPRRAASESGSM